MIIRLREEELAEIIAAELDRRIGYKVNPQDVSLVADENGVIDACVELKMSYLLPPREQDE